MESAGKCKSNSLDIVITNYHQASITFVFKPLPNNIKYELCQAFNLKFFNITTNILTSTNSELNARGVHPNSIRSIIKDGNCLFRAISFALSGLENNHCTIRRIIVDHLSTHSSIYDKYVTDETERIYSIHEYIKKRKMKKLGSWGTHVEIMAAAKLFNILIYTYDTFTQRWATWSPFPFTPIENIEVLGNIYLNYIPNVHYEVVLGVGHNVTNETMSNIDSKIGKLISETDKLEISSTETRKDFSNPNIGNINNELSKLNKVEQQLIAKKLSKTDKKRAKRETLRLNRAKASKTKTQIGNIDNELSKLSKIGKLIISETDKLEISSTKTRKDVSNPNIENINNELSKLNKVEQQLIAKKLSKTDKKRAKRETLRLNRAKGSKTKTQIGSIDNELSKLSKIGKLIISESDKLEISSAKTRKDVSNPNIENINNELSKLNKVEQLIAKKLSKTDKKRAKRDQLRLNKAKVSKTNFTKSKKLIEKATTKFMNKNLNSYCYICVSCHRICRRPGVCRPQLHLYKNSNCISYRYLHACKEDCKVNCSILECRSLWICLTCDRKLKAGKVPPESFMNNLELDTVPNELSKLNKVEQQLVALQIPFRQMVALPKGRQHGIHGSVVVVPCNFDSLVQQLPREAHTDQVIKLKLKRKLKYKGYQEFQTIKKRRLIEGLKCLKLSNKLYKDVDINLGWENTFVNLGKNETELNDDYMQQAEMHELNNLPNEVVILFHEIEEEIIIITSEEIHREIVIEFSDNDSNHFIYSVSNEYKDTSPIIISIHSQDVILDKPIEDDYNRGLEFDSCLQPIDLGQYVLDNFFEEIISVAPAEGNTPISMLNDKTCEAKCFPTLFPSGKGHFHDNRPNRITLSRYFNVRLLNADTRFSQNIAYIFWAQYLMEITRIVSSISIVLRKTANKLKGGQKLSISKNILTDAKELRKLFNADLGYSFLLPIRGSPPYWSKVQKDLKAMIRQLGKPTFFCSFSSAEMRWNDTIETLLKREGRSCSVKSLDYQSKIDLIRRNPVALAMMFYDRWKNFLNDIILGPAQPIGIVKDYFSRVEFQARGSPHIHALFWIADAPEIGKVSIQKIIEFVDKYISCNSSEGDPELCKIVQEVQTHSKNHSDSCRKKKTTCRYGFPQNISNHTFFTSKDDFTSSNVMQNVELDCNNNEIVNDKYVKFYPLTKSACDQICQNFQLLNPSLPIKYKSKLIGHIPNSFKDISADGNCLFRGISYCLSGTEDNHERIRFIIIKEMLENPDKFNDYIGTNKYKSIEEYVEVEKMLENGQYGTDLEIYAASFLFNINIIIYKVDSKDWLTYQSATLGLNSSISPLGNIYLNLDNEHFKVILGVEPAVNLKNDYFNEIHMNCNKLEAEKMLSRMKSILIDKNKNHYNNEDVFNELRINQEILENACSLVFLKSKISLKRQVSDIWVNPYNADLLRPWNANMDIQYITNIFEVVQYISTYISKTEREQGKLLKTTLQEALEDNLSAKDCMKELGKQYFAMREVSAQEAVFRLCGFEFKRASKKVIFIPTGENKIRMTKSISNLKCVDKLELNEDDLCMISLNDRYYNRPNLKVFNDMCLAYFASRYNVIYKGGRKDAIKLSNGKGFIVERKNADLAVIRYYCCNIKKDSEKYYGAKLELYLPHRTEEELKGHCSSYEEFFSTGSININRKITSVNALINLNEKLFNLESDAIEIAEEFLEEYGVSDDAWGQLCPESERERDECIQIGKDKVGYCEEDPKDDDADLNKLNLVESKKKKFNNLEENEAHSLISSLNDDQRKLFFFVRQYCISYINGEQPKPFHIFVSGGAGVGKSHLIKAIYYESNKILSQNNSLDRNPDSINVLITASTGVAAYNIGGSTLHSAFSLFGLDNKYHSLNDANLNSLRIKLGYLQILIIDEISMVGKKLLDHIDMRLGQIKGKSDSFFGDVCVLAIGDFYQLPPVKMGPLYKTVIGYDLWNSVFKLVELTKVMRQKDDLAFANLLNFIRVKKKKENLPLDFKLLLQSCERTIPLKDVHYLHIFPTNKEVAQFNSNALQLNIKDVISISARDFIKHRVTGKFVESDFPITNRKKKPKLPDVIELGIGARVQLIKNINVEEGLVNGAFGIIEKFITTKNDLIPIALLVLFDNKKISSKIDLSFESISGDWTRQQFPLTLAYACTVHKVQGLTLERAVVDLKNVFSAGQAYVALSRVTKLKNLIIKNLREEKIYCDSNISVALSNMEKLPLLNLFTKFNFIVLLNIQSILNHIQLFKADNRFQDFDFLFLTESWLTQDLTPLEIQKLKIDGYCFISKPRSSSYDSEFKDFGSSKGGGVICYYKASLTCINFPFNLITNLEFISILDHSRQLLITVIYRPSTYPIRRFCAKINELISELHAKSHTNSIIMGDFNVDFLSKDKSSLFETFKKNGYYQIVKAPTTDKGTLIDHIYIRGHANNFDVEILPIYYSYHNALKMSLKS